MRKLLLSTAIFILLAGTAWAQPQIDILQVPQWGQNKADILKLAGDALLQEEEDRINFKLGQAFGGEVIANYFFVEDKLMYARYDLAAFETEEFIAAKGYEDLLAGLKSLYGEPEPRESLNTPEAGQPVTYILDWVNDQRAVAFQRNGELNAINWMRVEHIDPAFMRQ